MQAVAQPKLVRSLDNLTSQIKMLIPKTLRQILNKLVWDKREAIANYEVTFIHRGIPGDRKTIPCRIITQIGPSWFTYESEEESAIIPFHRILEIKNVRNRQVIWSKKA